MVSLKLNGLFLNNFFLQLAGTPELSRYTVVKRPVFFFFLKLAETFTPWIVPLKLKGQFISLFFLKLAGLFPL